MKPRHRKIFLAGLIAVLVGFVIGAVAIFSAGIYHGLTAVAPDCGGRYRDQTPASFGMAGYEEVRFPSRDSNITIDAWWVPGLTADAPAVVLAHGMGECKRSSSVLTPAGMLHRHGYAVLVIDLRNEGSSTVTNGRFAGGVGEARDVLGAWDWLRHQKGIPASRIGLFGVSLGAGSVAIAMGQEPQVAAVWADSVYADLTETYRYQLSRRFIPGFFADIALEISRLRGEEVAHPSPLESMRQLNGRPLAIVAGEDDASTPVEQARKLARAAELNGGHPEVWTLPGVGHVGAMGAQPAEYERRLVAFFDAALGGGNPTRGVPAP